MEGGGRIEVGWQGMAESRLTQLVVLGHVPYHRRGSRTSQSSGPGARVARTPTADRARYATFLF